MKPKNHRAVEPQPKPKKGDMILSPFRSRRLCPKDEFSSKYYKATELAPPGLKTALLFAGILCALLAGACTSKPDLQSHAAPLQSSVAASIRPAAAVKTGPMRPATIRKPLIPKAPDAPKELDALKAHNAVSSPGKLTLLPGRTKRDSISLAAAIRAGTQAEPDWPRRPPHSGGRPILPATRIVAFYGNPLSKKMGVLGEYEVDEMLAKLDREVARWREADPSISVQPALHLIAVVAQGAPGRDGMYRLRMDTSLIETVYGWAQRKNALLFLDVQVGRSNLQAELPRLVPFLARPNVHLGIDPEFSMHYEREGLSPGKKIGEMDAADVNYAIRTLAQVAAENNLGPKILIVHRFTRKMVLNASHIRPDPHVQIVMNMDGWGPPWLKFDSYRDYIVAEPVQFTGFKLFYHNDIKKGDALLTPNEVLQLKPRPLYIQYQ